MFLYRRIKHVRNWICRKQFTLVSVSEISRNLVNTLHMLFVPFFLLRFRSNHTWCMYRELNVWFYRRLTLNLDVTYCSNFRLCLRSYNNNYFILFYFKQVCSNFGTVQYVIIMKRCNNQELNQSIAGGNEYIDRAI